MTPIYFEPRFRKTVMAIHVLQALCVVGLIAGMANMGSKDPSEQAGGAVAINVAVVTITLLGIAKLLIRQLNESTKQSLYLERQIGLLERIAGTTAPKPEQPLNMEGPTKLRQHA